MSLFKIFDIDADGVDVEYFPRAHAKAFGFRRVFAPSQILTSLCTIKILASRPADQLLSLHNTVHNLISIYRDQCC